MSSFSFAVLCSTVSTGDTQYPPWDRKEHSKVMKGKKRGIFNRTCFNESPSLKFLRFAHLHIHSNILKENSCKDLPLFPQLTCLEINHIPQHAITYTVLMPTRGRTNASDLWISTNPDFPRQAILQSCLNLLPLERSSAIDLAALLNKLKGLYLPEDHFSNLDSRNPTSVPGVPS